MQATIGATFLIVFRETLAAGLIIGAILTVLSRLKAGSISCIFLSVLRLLF